MTVLFYLVLALVVLVTLYAGIVIGVSDCKKRFNIPKGAIGVDNDGYIYH